MDMSSPVNYVLQKPVGCFGNIPLSGGCIGDHVVLWVKCCEQERPQITLSINDHDFSAATMLNNRIPASVLKSAVKMKFSDFFLFNIV